MLREIVWVIFDEIHYMQDRERGVVWEETIVCLPHVCRMVFLSATLSNAQEFAEWIASLHDQPCHVVYTEYRPTPLEHFGLPCQKKDNKRGGIYRICDQGGNFSMRMWADLQAAGVLRAQSPDVAGAETAAGTAKKRKQPDTDATVKSVVPAQNSEQPRNSRRDLDVISGRVCLLCLSCVPQLMPLRVVNAASRVLQPAPWRSTAT